MPLPLLFEGRWKSDFRILQREKLSIYSASGDKSLLIDSWLDCFGKASLARFLGY